MEEFSLIHAIKQKHYSNPSLIKGVGDDAAVFRQTAEDIVTAVDTFVEGIHFTRDTMTPFHVGYRALAANISDMAAMGATPAFYLVSIVAPKSATDKELLDIFSGMKKLANNYQMDLIGGDTVSGNELTLSITIIGFIKKEKARYRNLAKENDIVFVTGTLGDSQAGLHILMERKKYKDAKYFINRHRMPTPRVEFARRLESLSRIALNDISDGIANEAAEIAESSQVNITLLSDKIPVSHAFKQFTDAQQHEWKYFGGEDFEILGTAPSESWEAVKQSGVHSNTRVTKIGYVTYDAKSYGNVFLKDNNKITQLKKDGYVHLK